ncbi:MAG: ABC transporter permease [bacterium]|uniref:FtsX-like permease family protein n=2 Tax=Bacteria candidate phyla TaxID=1783234 RepID=A0A101I1R5_UNCT6|nr:MAG: hypothetical protein XD76_1658 [candidate division TA06 bacterium 32_111]KUK87053.1 MAG: hypothetical protein XE03_1003 [candidate division TA06 bacterium 34_109]MDI6699647.1 ABC transporter permease [bacterium]HAF07347.1 hypothetical protein [candidate division WOR-3 bacterium]HCP16499.1 hypothetical protein [candidate division WOR-3 bacterium]
MIELFLESLRVSFDSIGSNKLRSFLTTLGIIIGVMTVIIVVSIIAGLESKVQQVFSTIGSNVIYVERFPWVSMGPNDWRRSFRNYVDFDDYKLVKQMIRSADDVGVSISRRFFVKYRGERLDAVSVSGISENSFKIENISMEIGIPISLNDIKYRRNVCVIGKDIQKNLFKNENPIGKLLTVDGRKYIVIGVTSSRGSIFGQSMDEVVYLPYSTLIKYYGEESRRISIMVRSFNPDETIEELRWIMRLSHSLKPNEPDNFYINTQDALINQWKSLTTAIFFVMIAVGSLSLIVGGIGIMNIMLVSVSERTREIGIRKSIGAKNREILLQFLFESITISLTGGIIGIIIGFLISFTISKLTNLPFAIPLWSVILGFTFSVSAGLFFGILPSRKAASLDPVECLRYE